jgi:hypothetical protein
MSNSNELGLATGPEVYVVYEYRMDDDPHTALTRSIVRGILLGIKEASEKDAKERPIFQKGELIYLVKIPHFDLRSNSLNRDAETYWSVRKEYVHFSYAVASDAIGTLLSIPRLIRRGTNYLRKLDA